MAGAPSQDPDGVPDGVVLPLDVIPQPLRAATTAASISIDGAGVKVYSPERQRDLVRLLLTCGLLLILGYLVVFATIESASYPSHWSQTKEMLQIILPALTGIIGTVIGFYFGTAAAAAAQSQPPAD